MDAFDKLLRKIKNKDKFLVLEMMRELKNPESRALLDIKKLSGGDFYRARKGVFRVIFHFKDEKIIVDAIRLRTEKTYREY